MRIHLIDPKGHSDQPRRRYAERPESIAGLTIGLLSNRKANADLLLAETAQLFAAQHGCIALELAKKDDVSRPAEPETLRDMAARSDFLITAAGD